MNPFGIEAIEKCPGGEEAHVDHLDLNEECPWCGAVTQKEEPKPRSWRYTFPNSRSAELFARSHGGPVSIKIEYIKRGEWAVTIASKETA